MAKLNDTTVHFNTTHGMSKTRTYASWNSMRNRCNLPTHHAYSDYGGRGIFVYTRWDKFENFIADMGERPDGLTLDRYPDNKGNYEPDNCRWATPRQQSNNRVTNRLVTLNGETLTIKQLSRRCEIKYTTLLYRIKLGWPVEKAMTAKVDCWIHRR